MRQSDQYSKTRETPQGSNETVSMDGVLLYLCLMFLATAPSVEFQVKSQDKVLVAEVGSDVLLPCTLSPPINSVGLEVRWFRALYFSPVFLSTNGREDKEQQDREYRGRVSLQGGPETGDLSLSLHQLRLSDNGTYNCFVEHNINKTTGETAVQLNVVALGSLPHLEVSLQDSSVLISLSTDGWFPEPTIQWERQDGSTLTPKSKTSLNHSSGFFRVESRILLQDSSDEDYLMCTATNHMIEKKTGAYIKVSGALFPRVSPLAYAFYCMLFILLAGALLTFCYVKRLLKEKEDNLRTCEELTSQVEWRTAVMSPDPITFLPETAHPGLSVSADRLVLSPVRSDPVPPPNNSRFETELCCLGHPTFLNGRHYWEVDVGQGLEWAVGISTPDVSRIGAYMFSPTAHIWCIARFVENLKALDTTEKNLVVERGFIERVGVYLNINSAEVSFYNPDNWEKLYTFTKVSTERGGVHPFFWVGNTGTEVRLKGGREVQMVMDRGAEVVEEDEEREEERLLEDAV